MQGLTLSRQFYEACRPTLWADMPDIMQQAAVGLAGEGSECFGCDDVTSRDHDFGPAFCLWLPRALLRESLPRVNAVLARLPQHFGGYVSRLASLPGVGATGEQAGQGGQGALGMNRVGPLAVEDFYQFFTGLEQPPANNMQWLGIPEYQLAACTNGAVFEDHAGVFSAWRSALSCYPEDVRLKKLAARCMVMAQAGQYNIPRSLGRGDGIAALLALGRFAEAALSLVFLCNGRYMPFYKWAGKQAAALPVLGAEATRLLAALAATPLGGGLASHAPQTSPHPQAMPVASMVEELCAAVAAHLRATGLSSEPGDWLWAHGPQILRHVQDAALRRMDMLQG